MNPGRGYTGVTGRRYRAVVVTAVLVFFGASSVWGRTACREPVKPELPSTQADSREMEKAGKEIDAYIKAMTSYRECCLKLVTDADNELNAVVEGWNYAVEEYGRRSVKRQGNK